MPVGLQRPCCFLDSGEWRILIWFICRPKACEGKGETAEALTSAPADEFESEFNSFLWSLAFEQKKPKASHQPSPFLHL